MINAASCSIITIRE